MIVFFSILIFLAVFVITAKALEIPLRKGYAKKLLSDGSAYNAALPSKLSLAILPQSRVFRSLTLPIPGKDGQEIQLGTVIVSRSGVFILCQINGAGILENKPSEKWKHICGGKFSEFDNPFNVQADARTLINYYLELEGVTDVKAHTLVLYTNSGLRFTEPKSRSVIYINDFVKRLTAFERKGKLSLKQLKATCTALKEADSY